MDARRKPNNFDNGPLSPGKPQVDSDTKVTLSQFQAACRAYKRWKVTAGQISKHLQGTLGNLAEASVPDITLRLDTACSAGYLAVADGMYEFTAEGIDVVGEQRSELEPIGYLIDRRRKYQNRY